MSKPPPLPAEVLARVLRIAGIDGYTLIFIAGGFGFISGSSRDVLGALTGLLAAGAGFIELNGRKRLRAGDRTGVTWLVQSQLALLAVVLFYIAYQLHNFDVQPLLATVDHALAIAQRSLDVDVTSLAGALNLQPSELTDLATRIVRIAYVATGITSIFLQGGLAFYYHRKRNVIGHALRKI